MRILDVKEAEQKVLSGGEPDFTKSDVSIARALNWYAYYRDYKDSRKYLLSYMTKNGYSKSDIDKLNKVPDSMFSNTGFVCRLIERGAKLEEKNIKWIKDKIISLLEYEEPKSDDKEEKPKFNIQDRINEQSSEMIGELEGFVDSYKEKFNPYEWMTSNGVKSVHAKKISNHFQKSIIEPKLVLEGNIDSELKEAYSCFSKTDLKKYVAFIEQVIDDANRIVGNAKATKKPRKTKKPTADKLVSKLLYKKDDVEYKVVSINPSEIIGAKQLWVFNTKTRKLGVYHAWTTGGLTVKGTTINGFTDNSCSKTLRKPNDVLQALTKANERKYKSIFADIKSTEQELTGRINSDTILLKVFK
jgi:hypothetical protein